MPTIVGILTFMCRINFILFKVKCEKVFLTTGPGNGQCAIISLSLFKFPVLMLIFVESSLLFRLVMSSQPCENIQNNLTCKHILFDLILYVHSTIFQLCRAVLSGFNQY